MVDEAGVSSAVMSAPWSLGGERRGTGFSAAHLLLPDILRFRRVGEEPSLTLVRCSFREAVLNACLSEPTLERFDGLCQSFFECQPGLTCRKNREDGDAVVGHEESDQEGLAESDDPHARVME